MKEVEKKLSVVATEILEYELDEDSKQVAVLLASYITKNFSERSKCSQYQLKIAATEIGIEHDDYSGIYSGNFIVRYMAQKYIYIFLFTCLFCY